MKKLVVLICLFCYVVTATGFSFSLNYCNNVFTRISFDNQDDEYCCNEAPDKDCCESQYFKIEKTDEHNSVTVKHYKTKIELSDVLFHNTGHNISLITSHKPSDPYIWPPPNIPRPIPLYLLYSVFRI